MDTGFVLTDYGETKMYEIPSFRQCGLVRHGFTTRLGGRGNKPFDTLNLAFHVGDSLQTVIENRKIVCRALGTTIDSIVAAKQVHSNNIVVVESRDAGCGALTYDTAIPDVDGLVTNRPGLLLATFYADCVPIYILDPVKKVIASVHAGWKGTVARIGACAVKTMTETFGSAPANCLVGIGPSIGPCCYEVDEPVIGVVKREFDWWLDVLKPSEKGRARLDLWAANRRIMVEAGIKDGNVEMAHSCTSCNQQILFSFRGS